MRHAEAIQHLSQAEARINRNLGQRMRMFRRLQQLSLADVGAQLGLSGQMVHKYESGQSHIPAARLPRLAAVLGVSTNMLLPGQPMGSQTFAPIEPERFARRIEALLGHGAIGPEEPVH